MSESTKSRKDTERQGVKPLPRAFMYIHAVSTAMAIPVGLFSGWWWLKLREDPALAEEAGRHVASEISGFTVAEATNLAEMFPLIGAGLVLCTLVLWTNLATGRLRYA